MASRKRKDVGPYTSASDSTDFELIPDSQAIVGVRIFDVGQGDCIGLLDQDGKVCLYVDYGGYLDHPDSSRPQRTPQRLATSSGSRLIGILVTHWDQDHIYSAHGYNDAAQDSPWLVPRQWVSPFAARLAAKVKQARCWPEDLGQEVHRFEVGDSYVVEVRKCLPYDKKSPKEDRNLSGLAVTVLKLVKNRSHRQMVLPGDCPFDRIPHVAEAPIRHLVAYHHGASTHWSDATTQFLQRVTTRTRLSYSYSPRNSYDHPQRKNYGSRLNKNSVSTPSLRRKKRQYEDVYW